MPLTKDCAEYVASFVFGCTGLALGAVGVAGAATAAALPAVIGGTTLAGMWLADKKKRGPESEKALKKIIARIADETREGIGRLKYEHGQKLAEASALLGEHLPRCDMSREQLARDATDRSAALFPEAATDRVMIELAGKAPDVFGQGGNMIAISLARAVISAAFEAAIEDKAYFEQLEPHLLIEMARTAGEILAKVEDLEARLRSEFAELTGKIDGLRDGQADLLGGQAHMMAAIAELAARLPPTDLPDKAVLSLAERIVAETDGDEALALAELERAVEVARDLRKAGASLANLDGFVASVVSRMADLNDVGDEDAADGEYLAALAQMERDEAEEAERRREAKTALIDQGISQAYLRRDAEAVAQREVDKAALTASGEDLFQVLRVVRGEYYETGLRMGTRFDLLVGVALAEGCIRLAGSPENIAMAQNDLGIVLQILGERGETGALERSVAAYEAALEVYTQEAMPADWAMTQNNLGNVLATLGERGEAGALERAVTAFEAALEVYTQEAMPARWAMTQNNLGGVLFRLGERGEAGALERSVAAYEAALEVYTREGMPAAWAIAQNNLGNVLRVLGGRGEAGALERSVEAFEAALEVRTQEAMPAQWAMTQNNLGNVLQTLGERREAGALERSVTAYEAALEVYTQEAMPAQWAATQNNLGAVLQTLGERGEAGALERSVAAYEAALEVYTQEAMPAQWAMTQNNLGIVRRAQGDAGTGRAAYLAAEQHYLAALEIWQGDAPAYAGMAEGNLARVREKLAGLG